MPMRPPETLLNWAAAAYSGILFLSKHPQHQHQEQILSAILAGRKLCAYIMCGEAVRQLSELSERVGITCNHTNYAVMDRIKLVTEIKRIPRGDELVDRVGWINDQLAALSGDNLEANTIVIVDLDILVSFFASIGKILDHLVLSNGAAADNATHLVNLAINQKSNC